LFCYKQTSGFLQSTDFHKHLQKICSKNARGDIFLQEGSTVLLTRPADPEEDLKLMAQEVRDYVEAVLNSLAANIPKAVVLCQVERAREAMLNQLYSSVRYDFDHNRVSSSFPWMSLFFTRNAE
jgi:hypothetical protein